jgi:hypothetical protein
MSDCDRRLEKIRHQPVRIILEGRLDKWMQSVTFRAIFKATDRNYWRRTEEFVKGLIITAAGAVVPAPAARIRVSRITRRRDSR